jgi:hypothetical protein
MPPAPEGGSLSFGFPVFVTFPCQHRKATTQVSALVATVDFRPNRLLQDPTGG